MKLDNKYSWTDRFRKTVGGMVLGAALLFAATAIEAANNPKIDLQGCHTDSKKPNGYHGELVPDVHPDHPDFMMYMCNQDAYVQGNLGKGWVEYDMVPQHISVTNVTGEPKDIIFEISGDYLNKNGAIGWDYISEFTLDVKATLDANDQDQSQVERCKAHGAQTDQELIISTDKSRITRKVIIKDFPNNLVCVPMYNMRLALTASNYPGASLQVRLETTVDGKSIGDQTLSIPVDKERVQLFGKSMSAVQGGVRNWSVRKTATPGTVTFEDTCSDAPEALVKDVEVRVTWEKGAVTPAGKITVTTTITATNPALRPLNISVVDTLYSSDTPIAPSHSCTTVEPVPAKSPSNYLICEFDTIIDEAFANDTLTNKAVATYSDPDVFSDILQHIAGQKEAIYSTDVANTGSNTDETAEVRDHQWIEGNGLKYSVDSLTGTGVGQGGDFHGYTLGTQTDSIVNWTSDIQNESRYITFVQKIYADKGSLTHGDLNDTATVYGSNAFVSPSSSAIIHINRSAYVKLKITKTLTQEVIDEDKALDFNFTIRLQGGEPVTETIHFEPGEESNSITIAGMEPGTYKVEEVNQAGYATVGENPKTVILELPTCQEEVTFTNKLAGRPAVKAKKVTFPATIGNGDLHAGWTMTLSKQIGNDWVVQATKETNAEGLITFIEEDHLTAGTYKIEETMKDGWYKVGESEDCTFTYDGGNRQDYVCSYGNAKFAKIIIKKEVISNHPSTTKFNFEQDIDESSLELSDDQNRTYSNLRTVEPGEPSSIEYEVTEDVVTPHFSLQNLVCEEYYSPGVPAIENSSTSIPNRRARIVLDPGETVACTFTNKVEEHPSITIEKSTNTEDADIAPGPHITVGDPVNWAYVIQNTGDVALSSILVTDNQGVTVSCQETETTLNIGEIMTCTASGTATQGQYSNLGTVTARTPEGATTSNEDPSHYFGEAAPVEHPSIVIEKSTNGQDADTPTGPTIIVGSSVNWRYIVHNNGDVALSNITVNDNKIGAITCPQTALAVGASMTCTDSGIAIEGQYANIGTVTAKTPDSATVTDTDPSHYLGELAPVEHPSILIEKSTNGEDADVAPGPYISVGDPVNWEYVIYNNGDVDLNTINIIDSQGVRISCPATVLAVGKGMTCTASGTATEGQYSNLGTVTARSPEGATASNEDPSHYFGEEVPVKEHPSIDIEKYTNGEDADTAGPSIPVGETVTWTYVVHNTGDVNLSNISVTDDQGVEVSCPKTTLVVDEEMTCTASGTAVEGPYTNIGTVTSRSPEGTTTTDDDTSHYLGAALPSMNIEKSTNGEDADVAPGPKIVVNSPIEWTYTIHNTGNVPLREITVTDDQEVEVSCPQTTLEVDETMTCTAMGTATIGQYKNIGTVTAIASEDIQVSDEDTSHYLGTDSAVDPEEGENCPCNDVKSDSSSTFGTVSAILMMLMTLMAGLFFVRREELLNRNER